MSFDVTSGATDPYWDKWLPNLGHYLERVKEAVTRKYSDPNDIALPFYTPHGPAHFKAVEDLIHKLIPREKLEKLDERERFYLLASAWLHDIGMLRSVSEKVSGKHLDPTEIRKNHHVIAQKYIANNFHNCGLEEKDSSFIGKLCRFHRKQEYINDCEEELLVDSEKYKLKLLAAYLRLADALQIDASRTPASAYAICLAYDIPSEAKLHWIKSKLVHGVHIDSENHLITVQFCTPSIEQLKENRVDSEWTIYKIDNIIKHVMDDLRDELSSVMYILTRYGITYYLDIEEKRASDFIDDQTLNDLLSLVMNYDILVAPSASKLLEMILITVANIVGYHVKKNGIPIKFSQNDIKKTTKEIDDFLIKLEENILARRPCHLGLRSLIDECKEIVKNFLPNNLESFVKQIDILFQNHHIRRNNIRNSAEIFFEHFISNSESPISVFTDKNLDTFNILLFGYSELVIKALCGFRRHLIGKCFSPSEDPKAVYGSHLEGDISKKFRIFICEGQPKTQTAPRDRLLYHDGYSYALALMKRNFKNIILIPDIVAGNIIENSDINLVMVGANGFTENWFKHSAGHGSIINLVVQYCNSKEHDIHIVPKVALVVSTDKWASESNSRCAEAKKAEDTDRVDIEGYYFWKGFNRVNARENIWFPRDKNFYDEIQKNKDNIMFYNPREDIVPIEYLDYIISDIGYFPINSRNKDEVKNNIDTFFANFQK